jgi:hypothetical protein
MSSIEEHGSNHPYSCELLHIYLGFESKMVSIFCCCFLYILRQLFCLRHGPYIRNVRGIGITIAAKHSRKDAAHCIPRFSNICFEKSGKPAATVERRIMFAATVEAALSR